MRERGPLYNGSVMQSILSWHIFLIVIFILSLVNTQVDTEMRTQTVSPYVSGLINDCSALLQPAVSNPNLNNFVCMYHTFIFPTPPENLVLSQF